MKSSGRFVVIRHRSSLDASLERLTHACVESAERCGGEPSGARHRHSAGILCGVIQLELMPRRSARRSASVSLALKKNRGAAAAGVDCGWKKFAAGKSSAREKGTLGKRRCVEKSYAAMEVRDAARR